jgi:hypothetical protein
MGKPVVSVRTPEIEKYADVVEIADSREDFLLRLDKVLSRADFADAIRERMSRVAHESWEARLQAVHETVERFRDRLPAAVTTKPGHSVVAVESQHV